MWNCEVSCYYPIKLNVKEASLYKLLDWFIRVTDSSIYLIFLQNHN